MFKPLPLKQTITGLVSKTFFVISTMPSLISLLYEWEKRVIVSVKQNPLWQNKIQHKLWYIFCLYIDETKGAYLLKSLDDLVVLSTILVKPILYSKHLKSSRNVSFSGMRPDSNKQGPLKKNNSNDDDNVKMCKNWESTFTAHKLQKTNGLQCSMLIRWW